MENNEQNIKQQTLFDVKKWIVETKPYSKFTERDYLAQINRCPIVFRTNSLDAISADIASFEERMPKDAFPPAFATVKSYLAWRKKMISVLKRFSGEFDAREERRGRIDEWSALEEVLRQNIDASRGANRKLYIPLSILIDEARRHSVEPHDLDQDTVDFICSDLPVSRRKAVIAACRALQSTRTGCGEIEGLLPPLPLPSSESLRRNVKYPLSELTKLKIEELASVMADGEYDEILDETISGKKPNTKAVYKSALIKFIGTAIQKGILPQDTTDVNKWLQRETFVSVIREIILDDDKTRRVSNRTLRSYVSVIKNCAVAIEAPSAAIMEKALSTNRNLRQGFEDAKGMPASIQSFCSRLLKNRKTELLFLSMHVRFWQKAKDIIEDEQEASSRTSRSIQYGVLAAYAALALWGVPLRITNMLGLRHLGENPSLILPHRSRDKAYILIDAADVKNRRPIKAAVSSGPDKSLQILIWYLSEIRPQIPYSDRSNYFFPGFNGPQLSKTCLRDWLYAASRELGLPMTPHNFRHGLASLYVRAHPGDYSGAARLLCNTPGTVRAHYAWIDEDAEMKSVQAEVARMAGYRHV